MTRRTAEIWAIACLCVGLAACGNGNDPASPTATVAPPSTHTQPPAPTNTAQPANTATSVPTSTQPPAATNTATAVPSTPTAAPSNTAVNTAVITNTATPTPVDTLAATPTPTGGGAADCAQATPFASTFQAIQQLIFQRDGCNQAACHSSQTKQGGLDLSPDVAYQNLFQVASTEISGMNRIEPGAETRSYLWLKVAAATDPTKLPPGFQIEESVMPAGGLPPLSANELEALRLWIYSGAPETGTVGETSTLLNACLPTPEPIIIQPLDPPAPDDGVQFVMPPWHLEANSEHEICFATYYDLTGQVPAQYQDPTGTMMRFSGNELRQDPQSHHLLLNRFIGSADQIHDPSFGTWTCNGGDNAGQVCEPTDLTSCGTGTCTSTIQQSFACIGYGPTVAGDSGPTFFAIGGAQQAQSDIVYPDGVFAQIPMKGILYWNSHAFNLTNEDTTMHGRLNFYYAKNAVYPVQGIFDTSKIFAANAPPYTTQTICNDFVLPQGATLFEITSHTHHHGKHFTIDTPSGQLYESFVYNDPLDEHFNPPLVFDSADPTQRTLHYCSLYNNGVAEDGSPDPTLVTRFSLLPTSAKNTIGYCTPKACVSGKIGAACNGSSDNHTCDSSPGANDGMCDACQITGGESTQNEMFILIGNYYLPGATSSNGQPALDARGQSTETGLVLPPVMSCSNSPHAAHAAMMANHAGH